MAAINIRLSDEKHERLKQLAKSKNISVNKLMEELATIALTSNEIDRTKPKNVNLLVFPSMQILMYLSLAMAIDCC